MKPIVLITVSFLLIRSLCWAQNDTIYSNLTSSLKIKTSINNGKLFFKKRNAIVMDGGYKILIQEKDKTPNNASLFGGISSNFSEQGYFNKGLKTGHWQTLYKHTLVKSEHWNNGLITGKYAVYNTNKKILYSTDFGKQGNGKYKAYYYKTGILKEEGNYENGKKEGEWCFYTKNGTKTKTTVYNKGIPQ